MDGCIQSTKQLLLNAGQAELELYKLNVIPYVQR